MEDFLVEPPQRRRFPLCFLEQSLGEETGRQVVVHGNGVKWCSRTNSEVAHPLHCGNGVVTSKYTRWNFLPKNLWEQFQKVSNLYFLMICILQTIPSVSTTGGVPTTAFPLILVLAVNAAKDGYEDWRRHLSDRMENNQITHKIPQGWEIPAEEDEEYPDDEEVEQEPAVDTTNIEPFGDVSYSLIGPSDSEPSEAEDEEEKLTPMEERDVDQLEEVRWADIVLGDIICCSDRENIPADIVLIATSDDQGEAFIETANLDGETNLKVKQSPKACLDALTSDLLKCWPTAGNLSCSIRCPPPDANLNAFDGVLQAELRGERHDVSVSVSQLLLRGCKLRNTEWALGVVVYTGKETKIQKNSSTPPHKVSKVERLTNILTLIILGVQVLVCLVGAVATGIIASNPKYRSRSYLDLESQSSTTLAITRFFTSIVLFQNFIPISLVVTMGIVKAFQAIFIMKDSSMYHKATKTFAACRTSDLNEELGQVEYVFTDKTGTLTANVMEFRKCCIEGRSFGSGITQIRRRVLEKQGQTPPPDPLPAPGTRTTPNVNFVDNQLSRILWDKNNSLHLKAVDFFYHLAINHAVVAEKVGGDCSKLPHRRCSSMRSPPLSPPKESVRYSASSPDEGALVYGAKHFGIEFVSRYPGGLKLSVQGEEITVSILATFDFTSARKRSSTICSFEKSNGQKRTVLFCKGADNIILERLNTMRDEDHGMMKIMEEYAVDGLRTLCLAKRELDDDELSNFLSEYQKALLALDNRKEALEAVAEKVERALELQGVTGIEDRLQDGVGETIEALQKGGVHIWMLTGDKVETAINIGVATNLLHGNMEQTVFQYDELESPNTKSSPGEIFHQRLAALAVKSSANGKPKRHHQEENLERAVVVDGECLRLALDSENQKLFVDVCVACKTVICCRVTPQQKGDVVKMVKSNLKCVTLAIGDGANDCNMIQSAHVGIGLRGEEGLQAYNTSDYGLSQFRFLRILLLVHGRWCYRRISKLVIYMFYKNIVVVMPIFYFSIISLFGGQKIYIEFMFQLYNVLLTSMPIMIFGVFDQDVSRDVSLAVPELYKFGIQNFYFSFKNFFKCILGALWHSVPIFAIPLYAFGFGQITAPDFVPTDIWFFGQVVFLLVMIVVNIRVFIETAYLTWLSWLVVALSLIAWFVFMIIFSEFPQFTPESLGLLFRIAATPVFWIVIIAVPIICLSRDIIWKVLKRNFFPELYHEVQHAAIVKGRHSKTLSHFLSKRSFDQFAAHSPLDRVRMSAVSAAQYVRPSMSSRGFAFADPDHSAVQSLKRQTLTSGQT